MQRDEVGERHQCKRQQKLLYFVISAIFLTMSACSGAVTSGSQTSIKEFRPDNGTQQEVISAYELHRILTDHFGYVTIKLSDVSYKLPDDSKLEQLKNLDFGKPGEGIGHKEWGGDDYAIAAMVPMRNYAFGAMLISDHQGGKQVMNVLVNRRREVVYWEPRARQYSHARVDKPELILF